MCSIFIQKLHYGKKGVKFTFCHVISKIWNIIGPYFTNLEYKLVMMVKKTIWMILISIRLNFDTRKVQKYVKCKEIDLWGGQNHVLCYFIRNLGLRWPILHQSWVQIDYDFLENNMNDSHVKKKSLILTLERGKNTPNARKSISEGVKITFYAIS